MSTPHDTQETDVRESNPNGAGPRGLEGDMGISSERTGPEGRQDSADTGIEGTGSHGSAPEGTDGLFDTERRHPQDPAEGPDEDAPGQGDEPAPERTSTEEPAEGAPDKPDETARATGIDRTVGEVQPDGVANKHEFDPSRNPGH
jgi:hypothetical protein